MAYHDIDEILMEQELVPVAFKTEAKWLGHLDPGSASPDLPEGARLDIPFWMVVNLHHQDAIEVFAPKQYSQSRRNALIAEATSVNLNEWSSYYYRLGLRLENYLLDVGLMQVLQQAFIDRYRNILDLSQHSMEEDATDATRRLDSLEKKPVAEFRMWKRNEHGRMSAASIVSQGRKRKAERSND
ncbi:hypothetical protein CAOG_008529 [Capsaspora owczarzaki ATCC 30864]|uniref:DNA replication complex GINS protein PSF3 N-terminal domain-containing protein n=1 Tax=Capsaspora owczarzaki (strain ATCC 30864) TaxID=595528 RepID=A0A0D2U546_CAPO3|nr:hypothetical protein CAOG_008529 [Capsaspora owczarzaki ATCC 30864]